MKLRLTISALCIASIAMAGCASKVTQPEEYSGFLSDAMAGIWFFLQAGTPRLPAPVVAVKPAAIAPAQMVDEQQCQGCHQAQVKDWRL